VLCCSKTKELRLKELGDEEKAEVGEV